MNPYVFRDIWIFLFFIGREFQKADTSCIIKLLLIEFTFSPRPCGRGYARHFTVKCADIQPFMRAKYVHFIDWSVFFCSINKQTIFKEAFYMTQELTLFDLGEEKVVEEKKDNKQKEKKPTPTSAGVTKAPKKEDKTANQKVHGDWSIHFATEHFMVTDFVEVIPSEGVSLEEVRESMEIAFPQFSAARTKWDVDEENKRLFPDAFAGSKGAITKEGVKPSFFETVDQAIEAKGMKKYVVSGDGKVMEVKSSIIGKMVAEVNKVPAPIINPSFTFDLPKIPNKILRQIIGFFRAFVSDDRNFEVALRVYWDCEDKCYIVECPKQTVTPVRIDLSYSEKYTGRHSLRYVPVLEVHSHNVMRAFWSQTDDQDEQAYGIYGVFGRLDRAQIDMCFRVKNGENFVVIPAKEIFELSLENQDFSYPKEWNGKVTIKEGGFYL